jgi:hypothetical protein
VARPSAQKHINHLNDFTAYANILFAVTESSSVASTETAANVASAGQYVTKPM